MAASDSVDLWVPNWSSTSGDLGIFVDQQIPRLLSHPGSARFRGGSQKVHAAGGMLHEKQHIQPLASSVSTQKKSVARMPCA